MKRFRLFAAIVAAVVVLLLLAVGVAFNASFQTWLVRRALARDPQLGVTVERVSAGVRHVELRGLRFENSGAVLTVPLAEAELPVLSAAFGEKISITQLVAKGWTLDLSKAGAGDEHGVAPVNTAGTAPAPRAGSGAATSPPVDTGATGASGPAGAFAGIFSHLRLPFDLMLDGVALEGEVILPRLRGRAKVSLRGGGVASGREGKFELRADTALADPAVSSLALHGTLAAAMDTPRSFSRLGARLEAAASGTQFPQGVKLTPLSPADHDHLAKVSHEVAIEWAQNLDRRGKSGTEVLNALKAGLK